MQQSQLTLIRATTSTFVESVNKNTPKMVKDDERWCQRRLVAVLFHQAVSIETPRL